MDNSSYIKIAQFLEDHPTLDSINKVILQAENDAKERIKQLEAESKRLRISVRIDDADIMSRVIAEYTGIWGLRVQYQSEFQAQTGRVNSWSSLRYAVQGSLLDYDRLHSAEVKGDYIKTDRALTGMYPETDTLLKKQYANGKAEYWLNEDLQTRLDLAIWIETFLCNKMGWNKNK